MKSNASSRLRELTPHEALGLCAGDCTLQYHLGMLAGSAARAVVSFGRGLLDGLSGK